MAVADGYALTIALHRLVDREVLIESIQAKPAGKRRRWLIVAFVVVFVSLVSWWYWPRGDARFVGKWAMLGFDSLGGQRSATMTLRRNGTGITLYPGQQPLRFGWRVENERLIIGPWPPPNEEEYEIVDWSESQIDLLGKKLADGAHVTLSRISE